MWQTHNFICLAQLPDFPPEFLDALLFRRACPGTLAGVTLMLTNPAL